MKPFRVLLIVLVFTLGHAERSTPEITTVEPPHWWSNHSLNPVRLLIHGRNLRGAVVTARPGMQADNVRVNDEGTYVFVDLTITNNLAPGSYPLRLNTPDGNFADVPFEIRAPLPRERNFQGFNHDDVIYLIMPDRFSSGDQSNDDPAVSRGLFDRSKGRRYHGGDLQGIINHLPYLKELGVTALWLNPIYDNNNQLDTREVYDNEPTTGYHGYGAVDFYGVEEHFGDLNKFRELVKRAHDLGMKIIQDQVANHTGPYHSWVKDAPTPTWFNGTEGNHINENWQTHLLMDRNISPSLVKPVLDGWFVNILPDLNQNDPDVSRYIIQNTLWWIGTTGLDAIRQDTLPYVPRSFWRDWMTAIKREYPKVNVIGEVLDGLPAQVAFFQGGAKRWDGIDSEVDTLFDYPLYFALRGVFAQQKSLRNLVEVLNQDYLYPDASVLVTLIGSHDVVRFMNETGATASGLKLALSFILTTRGIPQLYYGDEIAMRGGNDPDNRRDFPGGFPGDSRNAFEVSGRTSEENDVFEHLKKMLHLRHEIEVLRRGGLMHLSIHDETYVYARYSKTAKTAIVILNNSADAHAVEFEVPSALRLADGAVLKNVLNPVSEARINAGRITVTVGARSAIILN